MIIAGPWASSAISLAGALGTHSARQQKGGPTLDGTPMAHDNLRKQPMIQMAPRRPPPAGRILVGKGERSNICCWRWPIGMVWSPARPEPARPSPCRCWRKGFRAPARRFSPPTSKAISPASACRAKPSPTFVKRAGELGLDLRARPFPVDLLGCVRRAGPPDPRHHQRNGAAVAFPDARTQRDAGRRPQHRLQGRRRSRACC